MAIHKAPSGNTIYGSDYGSPEVIRAVMVDATGRLMISAAGVVVTVALHAPGAVDPNTDTVGVYGSHNGAAFVPLLTDVAGSLAVAGKNGATVKSLITDAIGTLIVGGSTDLGAVNVHPIKVDGTGIVAVHITDAATGYDAVTGNWKYQLEKDNTLIATPVVGTYTFPGVGAYTLPANVLKRGIKLSALSTNNAAGCLVNGSYHLFPGETLPLAFTNTNLIAVTPGAAADIIEWIGG